MLKIKLIKSVVTYLLYHYSFQGGNRIESTGFIGYQVSMWNLLHISTFCFICYLVGYVKPFLYIFSF